MDKELWEELSITLVELNKAIVNINMFYQTAQSIGLFDLLKNSGSHSKSLLQLFKSVDIGQIAALLQSPLVQQILSDPEFFELFMPDAPTQESSPNDTVQS